ncbi:MAG TPA: ATP-binding protein [Pyrinomonadaceae bacterium]|jgi:serine/threonine-protein kinase RsbW|nr:ATP-binding protein [Pyrinomonadaceae bacterium]
MQRRILIIDDHNDLAEALDEVFTHTGHQVKIVKDRQSALALGNIDGYDLVITDLDGENAAPDPSIFNGSGRPVCMASDVESSIGDHIKAFKICATHFRRDEFDEQELKELVATTLDYKIRFVDKAEYVKVLHENIEFELPSAISLMHIVLDYLMKRVEKQGVVKAEQSNLFVALDEAFVNAIKHGNKYDSSKLIHIAAEISRHEARFTIEDEGEGFDVDAIPDPLDPDNLFKTSGRGVLFIYNIMDEVKYNERGNRLTMVKKSSENKI